DRWRLALGGVHRHPVAEDEARAPDRGSPALHGFVHDLHRAVRRHRRRPRQLDYVHLDRAGEDRARAVRPRQGGRIVAGLQPHHPHRVLGVLYRDDQRRRRTRTSEGGDVMHSIPGRRLILSLFLVFLLLPIYWLVNMSFKNNTEIVSTLTPGPARPTRGT